MLLVLASSSPYRRQLLQRLSVAFSCRSPNIDEAPRPHETPIETVSRLAREKAIAISPAFPNHLIIGSDQVALHKDTVLTKPGDHHNARLQLKDCSGQSVTFLTSLCVYNNSNNHFTEAVIPTEVTFRHLEDGEIERYLTHEKPYDCAGSFKAEGLGITLFDKIVSDDPTALIGLPLVKLSQMLAEHDYNILDKLI